MVKAIIVSIRPKQWVKNLIIFAGLVFSKNVFNLPLLGLTILAFTLFSLLSGALYIFNDLIDIKKDRSHPLKAIRPISSGKLPVSTAVITASLLAVLSLTLAFYIKPLFGLVAVGFLLINLIYTIYLKDIVILDVMTIAVSFILRALAGTVIVSVALSPWLLVCTILLALFLGLNKRRHELVVLGSSAPSHRPVLAMYSPALLDQMIAVVAAATVVAYALYTFTSPTAQKHNYLMLTIPFVLYGIFRYQYLVHQENQGGSPEDIFLSDAPSLINVLLWVAAVVVVLYLG